MHGLRRRHPAGLRLILASAAWAGAKTALSLVLSAASPPAPAKSPAPANGGAFPRTGADRAVVNGAAPASPPSASIRTQAPRFPANFLAPKCDLCSRHAWHGCPLLLAHGARLRAGAGLGPSCSCARRGLPVDWSDEIVVINSVTTTVKVAHVPLLQRRQRDRRPQPLARDFQCGPRPLARRASEPRPGSVRCRRPLRLAESFVEAVYRVPIERLADRVLSMSTSSPWRRGSRDAERHDRGARALRRGRRCGGDCRGAVGSVRARRRRGIGDWNALGC